MKKALYVIGLIATLASCEGNGLNVEDRSFSFSAEVSYENASDVYRLTVSLLSGSRTDDYVFEYLVDGSPALILSDGQGREFKSGSSCSFTDGTSVSFSMPALSLGSHSIHLSVSTESFRWEEDIAFEVTMAPLSVNAEINVNKENPNSLLLVSLKEGTPGSTYSIAIDLDGEPLEMEESDRFVDFSKKPILTVTIPTIRPGSHKVTVSISDGRNSSKNDISFEEPVRFPYLDLVISHDTKSGDHVLTVSRNPYGIRIKVTSQLSVTGSCTYWLGGNGWESYPAQSEYQMTKSKTCTDSRTVETVSAGEFVLAARDAAVETLTSQYEMSAVWAEVCDGENCYYVVTRYEPVYYRMTSETFMLEGEIESVPGITARISGSVTGTTWNGETLSSTPIDVEL